MSDNVKPQLLEDPFLRLDSRFYSLTQPDRHVNARLRWLNEPLCDDLNLEVKTLAAVLAGQQLLAGVQPYAAAYAGHQFGRYVPLLGDGRAHVIGCLRDKQARLQYLQLKGAGETVYARSGDGLCGVGPALREYLVSEFMHRMGIPTTRALAVVETGDWLMRDRPVPGAIITRVAPSFLRVGSMSFAASIDAVKAMADLTIELHYPHLMTESQPYLGLLAAIIQSQARLIAQWMAIGFVHGVMNTDNMTLFGDTIDYGPCAFINALNGQTTFSSIDRQGRYDYFQQPQIGLWNLHILAQAMLPLLNEDPNLAAAMAEEQLSLFDKYYQAHFTELQHQKLGLKPSQPETGDLIDQFWRLLAEQGWDYTLAFKAVMVFLAQEQPNLPADYPSSFTAWWQSYRSYLAQHQIDVSSALAIMRQVNPMHIPRNHVLDDAIARAEEGDWSPIVRIKQLLETAVLFDSNLEAPKDLSPLESQLFISFCGT